MLHQNLSHRAGGDGEKVFAICPWSACIGEAHIGFVNEGCCLQRLPGTFVPHVRGGKSSKLLVDLEHHIVGVEPV